MESLETIELKIILSPKEPWNEVITAELSEQGFDSFVDTEDGLIAYASTKIDVDSALSNSSLKENESFKFQLEKNIIPHKNWNAKWEENFHPVYIESFATILAPFHQRDSARGVIIEIQPKMSFGTGHHQTTWMMTKALFELDAMPKNVLDMGTGTGVLAIVTEKLGAERILAIDIEDWSAVNAAENAERNNTRNIECLCGDIDLLGNEKFGLVIANINKNILKSQMEAYSKAIENNGTLLLSGFFTSDVDEMVTFAEQFGFTKTKLYEKDEWAAIALKS
ncbi:MAG: 50S ribosomal protein L11 methyltransferase [Fluviicola sp.]|nr:50S ribosomal protein L11 methyltransferase [Fluviicola sp.]